MAIILSIYSAILALAVWQQNQNDREKNRNTDHTASQSGGAQ